MAKAITDATFEQETKDGLVLVDFWATCVVHVVCKVQSWINCLKNFQKMS